MTPRVSRTVAVLFSILIVTSLLTFPLIAAAVDTILIQTFEDGDVEPTNSDYATFGDTSKYSANSTDPISGSYSLSFNASGGDAAYKYGLKRSDGSDWKMEKISFKMEILRDEADASNSDGPMIKLVNWDGNAVIVEWFQEADYQENVVYNITITVNYSANNYDILSKRVSDGTIVKNETDKGFIANGGAIDQIRFRLLTSGDSSEVVHYKIDDIYIHDAGNSYNVNGTVKDSGGTAVEGATVSVNSTDDTATTGADGSYSLTLGNGTYKLTASKTSYANNSTTTTVSGSDLSDQNITLSQKPDISGTVVDQNGDPVENASVVIRSVQQKAITTISGSNDLDKSKNYLDQTKDVDAPDDWDPNFDPVPEGSHDTEYVAVHPAEDWAFQGGTYTGPDNIDLDNPVVRVQEGDDVIVSVWQPTGAVFGFGSRPVISELPGRPVVNSQEVTLTKLNPSGGEIGDPLTVHDVQQHVDDKVAFGTNIRNLLYRSLKPNVNFVRIPADSMSPGFYRVESSETDQEYVITYGQPTEILSEWSSQVTESGSEELIEPAKTIETETLNGNFSRIVVTTNESGSWNATVDANTVAVSVRAYDAPDTDAADSALSDVDQDNKTLSRVSQLLSDKRTTAVENWVDSDSEDEREDAVDDMPGVVRFSGSPERHDLPAKNVTLTIETVYHGAYSSILPDDWEDMALEQRLDALHSSKLISDPTPDPDDDGDRGGLDDVVGSDPDDTFEDLLEIRDEYKTLVEKSDDLRDRYEYLAGNSSLPSGLQDFEDLETENLNETELRTQIDLLEDTLLGGASEGGPPEGDNPEQDENESEDDGEVSIPDPPDPGFDVPFLDDDQPTVIDMYNFYPLPNETVRGVEVGATVYQDANFAEPLGDDQTYREKYNDSRYENYSATYRFYLDGDLLKRGTFVTSKQVSALLPENLSDGTHTWSLSVNSSYHGEKIETKKIAFTADSDAPPARDVLKRDDVFDRFFDDETDLPDRSEDAENATDEETGDIVDGFVSEAPDQVDAGESFDAQLTVYGRDGMSDNTDVQVRVMLAREDGTAFELGRTNISDMESSETRTVDATLNQDFELKRLEEDAWYSLTMLYDVDGSTYASRTVESIAVFNTENDTGFLDDDDPDQSPIDDVIDRVFGDEEIRTEKDLSQVVYRADVHWDAKGEFNQNHVIIDETYFKTTGTGVYLTNEISEPGQLSVTIRQNASDTTNDTLRVIYKDDFQELEREFDIPTVDNTSEYTIDVFATQTDVGNYSYEIYGSAEVDEIVVRGYSTKPGSGGSSPEEGESEEDVTEEPSESQGIGSRVLVPDTVEVIRTTTSTETSNGTDIISGRIETSGSLSNDTILFMNIAEGGLRKVDRQYYWIDQNAGTGDDVVIDGLPVDENRSVTSFEVVDVTNNGDVKRITQPVDDATTSTERPTIKAITATTLYPAVGETVIVEVEADTHSSFDRIRNATVLGPTGELETNVTDDGEVEFTPDDSGLHRVRLKLATVNGGNYTETIAIEATERPLDFAPRVRLRSTEYGVYAVGGRGVSSSSVTISEDGQVEVALELDRSETVNRIQVETGPVSIGEAVTVRVLDGTDQQLVQRQIALDLVAGSLPSGALVRRNGEPVTVKGTRAGTIDRSSDGVVIRTYTTDQGSARLTVNRNPGTLERLRFWIDTQIPETGFFGLLHPGPLTQGVSA